MSEEEKNQENEKILNKIDKIIENQNNNKEEIIKKVKILNENKDFQENILNEIKKIKKRYFKWNEKNKRKKFI